MICFVCSVGQYKLGYASKVVNLVVLLVDKLIKVDNVPLWDEDRIVVTK